MEKMTANKLYRAYKKENPNGMTFKHWIAASKNGSLNASGTFDALNQPLTDSLNRTLAKIRGTDQIQKDLNNKYVLGLPRAAWYIGGTVIVVAAGYFIYKKMSK